ncbi:16S rRNA (uracil(1498)-N(3))-methyltransferase [Catenovulum sediminis]|uniref:Ribosomal RNA small subunit methyltransferase E n=1 Tax=Catenovulum sediminis TaxID=1740262 RepID=A0ABV1RGM7_9ALTE|nr:16S rRNA (uracil(1498)-N(3))-methyltransferase [Catenovulum sediminis]
MRLTRIFQPEELIVNSELELSSDAANHVGRVLRLQNGHPIVLFNGNGFDYECEIIQVERKSVRVKIKEKNSVNNESQLKIHLAQVISRGDKMDFTLQKAVELGVHEISPLISERCGVKLNAERMQKKTEQWQKIVQSACEQCGRAFVPKVNPVIQLEELLNTSFSGVRLNLHPQAKFGIGGLDKKTQQVQLLIGPEGGLSDEEIEKARQANFTDILMGPRVLRTETAGLAAISMLQCILGDLG